MIQITSKDVKRARKYKPQDYIKKIIKDSIIKLIHDTPYDVLMEYFSVTKEDQSFMYVKLREDFNSDEEYEEYLKNNKTMMYHVTYKDRK